MTGRFLSNAARGGQRRRPERHGSRRPHTIPRGSHFRTHHLFLARAGTRQRYYAAERCPVDSTTLIVVIVVLVLLLGGGGGYYGSRAGWGGRHYGGGLLGLILIILLLLWLTGNLGGPGRLRGPRVRMD